MRHAFSRAPSAAAVMFLVSWIASTWSFAGERHDLPPSRVHDLPASIATVFLPAIDHEAARATEDALPPNRPYRFGVEVPVDLSPWTFGEWFERGSERVWRGRIVSTGAFSLHLLFDAFHPAPMGRLYVVADDSDFPVRGPFTARDSSGDGRYATAPTPGEAITLEYVEPLHGPRGVFRVSHVVHAYRDAFGFAARKKAGTANASGPCNINVNCPPGASHQDVKQSIALVVIGGGTCSGALLNNTAQDGAQLFLTANHCAVGGPAPTQWSFVFNYEVMGCVGNSAAKIDSVVGSTLIQQAANSDYCLVRINPPIPPAFKVYFAGYDATGAAITNTAGIHHPQGDPRKICFDDQPPAKASWQGADTWKIFKWDLGVTEPGSSGSPLFDANKAVVGQLYGGIAACGNPIDDYYGRLETTAKNPAVASALDPIGGAPTTLPGVDGSIVIDVDLEALSLLGPTDAETLETIDVAFDVASTGSYSPATYGYRLRISDDAVIDASDIEIDQGALSTFGPTIASVSIPGVVAPGAYFLGIEVDADPAEVDLADNVLVGNAITILPSTAPDVAAIAVSGPKSAVRGESIQVDFELSGNSFVAPPINAVVRLSKDDVLLPTDPFLGTVVANTFAPIQGTVTVPFSLPAGVYRLGLIALSAPGELDLADNTLIGGTMTITDPPPDVIAIGIDGPAKTKIGKYAKLEIDLDKNGVIGKVKYTVRLSLDPIISTDDLALVSKKTKKSGTLEIEAKIPNIPVGTYYWGVTIDGVENEIDFTNNAVAGGAVLVKPKN